MSVYMSTYARRIDRDLIRRRGWRAGSDLEDAVTRQLSSAFRPEEVQQQHPMGRFRLDYAWPDLKIALEVDGWHHRRPDVASRDADRDAYLRGEGWLVFRVDDVHGADVMADQVMRVCRVVDALRNHGDAKMIRYEERQRRKANGVT